MTNRTLRRVIIAALILVTGAERASAQCTGDVIPNGTVDGGDLAELLAKWGPCASCAADISGDARVNAVDLAFLLSGWGPCRPVIGSVEPNAGTVAGGTPITITGNYLLGATSVTVGGVEAQGVQVVSTTTIYAVTPPGPPGLASVAVTANGQTGALAGGFSYGASSISSVVPSSGFAQGGTAVTISGELLENTSAVWFGTVRAASFTQASPTQLTAVSPPGEGGTSVDIRLQTPAGLLVAPGAFSYLANVVPAWASLVEGPPDPGVVTSPALRAAIAATGFAWRVRDSATQIEFVLIPAGTFQMGCSPSEQYSCISNESPIRTVTLTQPFYMSRYEVTQAQWQARMGANPAYFKSASTQVPISQVPNRPVESVSWDAIQGFLAGSGFRLPTEAEWEWAYRAGTTTAFHSIPGLPDGTSSDSLAGNMAWWRDNSGSQTRPVGQKPANGFGLHDMAGNVWEWVNDWYANYPAVAQTNPTGPTSGSFRVYRGGSWTDLTRSVRSSHRANFGSPGTGLFTIGFRVARNP